MADEVEMMRKKMERTRASLARNLHRLMGKTVKPVEDTVENVTDTAGEVADSMKSLQQFFDVSKHAKKHPWAMAGGSLAFGFLAGVTLNKSTGMCRPSSNGKTDSPAAMPQSAPSESSNGHSPCREESPSEKQKPSWLAGLLNQFAPELNEVKSLAIGASLGLVRDMVSQNLPDNWSSEVRKIFNEVTEKAGGTTVGPVDPEELGLGSKEQDQEQEQQRQKVPT